MELFLREEFRPHRAPRDRHVQCERAAGRPLAIGAITAVEQQRKRFDLVADRTTRAAAGHGKRRSRRAHDQPRSKIRSEDYPEIIALRRLSPQERAKLVLMCLIVSRPPRSIARIRWAIRYRPPASTQFRPAPS